MPDGTNVIRWHNIMASNLSGVLLPGDLICDFLGSPTSPPDASKVDLILSISRRKDGDYVIKLFSPRIKKISTFVIPWNYVVSLGIVHLCN